MNYSRLAVALCCLLILPDSALLSQIYTQDIVRYYGHGLTNWQSLHDSAAYHGIAVRQQGLTIAVRSANAGSVTVRETVSVRAKEVAPFLTCTIMLKLSHASLENVRVRIRSSKAPVSRSEVSDWQLLEFDTHAEDEFSGNEELYQPSDTVLVRTYMGVIPAETQYLEVKLELIRTAQYPEPTIRMYRCFICNPGATRSYSLLQKGFSSIQSSRFPRPLFVTRTEWGCPWGQTSGPNTLTPTVPTHLIVHHSFIPGNNITDWPAAVRSIWTSHVQGNGWSDIGYNWLIDPQGTIYQGRAWVNDTMDNTQGAHFCGFNRATMGVCMLGDFTSITPTEAAQRSLVRLLAYRASANALDPRAITVHTGSNRSLATISGHRDGCATECPGGMLYALLPTIRQRVYALLNPPAIQNPKVSVRSVDSVVLSALVHPNGSRTDVVVEWDDAHTSLPNFRYRRMVHQFSADDSATVVSAVLSGLSPNTQYTYRFIAYNSDTLSATLPTVFAVTPTHVVIENKSAFLRIAPNPSTSESRIAFSLPQPSYARLTVRDVRGHVVARLLEQELVGGEHEITFRGENIASGMYYCYLEVFYGYHSQVTMRTISIIR
ncbi:MAG: N-acetylmuramoyl-L-alanine amidase [Bacteroidota bacterium]|nr:N-acetylmuramoyl-L-alanine amidase [Candidatus Kapabacteria bacterium]MDW8221060.1 N-acetylmuramoyl-L-alanine amidase [Bacteroidota bacterium]